MGLWGERAGLSSQVRFPGPRTPAATANFSASEVAEVREAARRAGDWKPPARSGAPPRLLAPKFAGAGPFKGPALRGAHVSGLRKPAPSHNSDACGPRKHLPLPGPLTLVETEAQESAHAAQALEYRSPAVLDAMSC